MKIAIDVMGGDKAPYETIKGGVEALKETECEIVLIGDSDIIEKELLKYSYDHDRISVIHASEIIENEDKPVKAIKKKDDSSMVVGLKLLRKKEIDGFVSAGNTGALLAGSLLKVGRIKGIDRPALGVAIPTVKGFSVLLDSGANVECKPRNLREFAIMGGIYSRYVLSVENPKVGLINVGTEEEKGTAMIKEAYGMIKEDETINFVGNIEGRTILDGEVDVIVCDGFTGNVLLKFLEGMAKSFGTLLKEVFLSSFKTKIGALLIKSELGIFKKKLDYKEYGGAPLLGINGNVVKAHGSSDSRAIKNAIKYAEKFAYSNVTDKIFEAINK
jgi:glycerol-3-phosphate acyltransferase PlsX